MKPPPIQKLIQEVAFNVALFIAELVRVLDPVLSSVTQPKLVQLPGNALAITSFRSSKSECPSQRVRYEAVSKNKRAVHDSIVAMFNDCEKELEC